jgi:hypothetical protein
VSWRGGLLLAASGLVGCGAPSVQSLQPAATARVVAGPAHHLLLDGGATGVVAYEVDRDGRILTQTALPPESLATVQLAGGVLIDRVAGRVRGRAPGEERSRWTYPRSGRALAALARERDVVVVDSAARLCVVDAGDGHAQDCVGLPDQQAQLVGVARFGATVWVWIRRPGAVLAYAMQARCAASARCEPRLGGLGWSAPLEASRPAPRVIGDAILLEPEAGVVEVRDGRTGAVRVTELRPRLGRLHATDGAMLLSGQRDDGAHFLACLDGRADAVRWIRAWPFAVPTAAVSGPGVLRVRAVDREWVLRARDGAGLGEVPARDAAAANEELWLGVSGNGARAVSLSPAPLAPMPPPPPRPAWLREGAVLHYLQTGPNGPPRRLSWTVLAQTRDAIRLQFFGEQDPARVQVWNAAHLGGALQLCVAPALGDAPGRLCPSLALGREPTARLLGGEAVSVAWPGRAPLATRWVGRGLHAASFRVGAAESTRLLHLPTLRLRAAGRDETMEVAEFADLPLLLHATAGEERVVLIGVSLPEGAALPSEGASGSASATDAR